MLKTKSHLNISNDNQSSFDDALVIACEKAELEANSSELISMDAAYFTAWEKRLTDNIGAK